MKRDEIVSAPARCASNWCRWLTGAGTFEIIVRLPQPAVFYSEHSQLTYTIKTFRLSRARCLQCPDEYNKIYIYKNYTSLVSPRTMNMRCCCTLQRYRIFPFAYRNTPSHTRTHIAADTDTHQYIGKVRWYMSVHGSIVETPPKAYVHHYFV